MTLIEMPAVDNTVVLNGRWPGLAAETADPLIAQSPLLKVGSKPLMETIL